MLFIFTKEGMCKAFSQVFVNTCLNTKTHSPTLPLLFFSFVVLYKIYALNPGYAGENVTATLFLLLPNQKQIPIKGRMDK